LCGARPAGEKRQTQPLRVQRDEAEIPVRVFAAKSVVDVADGEPPTARGRDGYRSVEKRHRIGSAGNREHDRGPRRHPPGLSRILERERDGVHGFMVTRGPFLRGFFHDWTNLAPQ